MHRSGPTPAASTLLALAAALACLAPRGAAAGVLDILEGMQANTWQQLNVNHFLDIVPAADERGGAASGYNAVGSVIYAWGSFAWDSKRSELLIFGGGHHNYTSNEMYKWSVDSGQWSLASLPSQMTPPPVAGGNWLPVDGALNAPGSAHTYDNNNYLAGVDRFITLGGGSAHAGTSFTVQIDATHSRNTGPYLFDPSKADPTKVGGTSGSGVLPGSVGGQMWQDRDLQNMAGFSYINGTSAAAVENGHDVLYFTARSNGTVFTPLYRLTISNVNNPASDLLEQVGTYFVPGKPESPLADGAAAYDPASRLYVALADDDIQHRRFVAWDMDTAGPSNVGVGFTPTLIRGNDIPYGPSAVQGIDFDPQINAWLIWNDGGSVWKLKAPGDGNAAGQWTLEQIADNGSFASGSAPAPNTVYPSGTRGKWHYASDLGAFIGLETNDQGNVWVFKPEGWVNPSAVPEPATWALFGAGALALALRRRKTG